MAEQLLKYSADFTAGLELSNKGSFVDCTLAVEGQTLKAHGAVLSAASSHFEVVRIANVTACENANSFITFEAITTQESSYVCEKVEGEISVEESADNKQILRQYLLHLDESSPTKPASVNDTNVSSMPFCEVKSDPGDFENSSACSTSEPAFGYELLSLVTDIEIKDEEILLNLKIEKDDTTMSIDDETTLEEGNEWEVSPGQDDAKLKFEDVVQSKSAVPNIGNGEKLFKCPSCDFETSQRTDLNVHKCFNVKSPFEWSHSSSSNVRSSVANNHELKHLERKSFKCSQCSYTCRSKQSLKSHMSRHTGEKPYKCSQCPYACIHKNSLKHHMRNHTGEKPFKCSNCTYVCSGKSNLIKHMRNHTEQKPFRCSKCTNSFSREHHLISHMHTHAEEKPFKCSHCTYACRHKNYLINHLRIHTGEKPFQCSQCTYTCSRKYNLIRHVRTHTGEKPFNCSYCTFVCSRKQNLILHMRSHTGEKPFNCSYCTFVCSHKQNLISHMCTHTGEKPFKCSQCTYTCIQKQNLNSHMRTHTGEKPFKCTECTYTCSWKHQLIRHVRKHTGKKPFNCSHCTFVCSRKHHLISHMRTHAGEKPFKCT